MIVKVVLGTMQNARKLVSIAEVVPYDAELCCGRYVVDAKSMLGVLSMPDFEAGELNIHTDNEEECEEILFPRATSQVAMLAWIFGDCREGQIPRCLQRCKFDTPLLAAGSLIGFLLVTAKVLNSYERLF